MKNNKFKKYLKDNINLVNKYLKKYLPRKNAAPAIIHRAVHYSVFNGGKRFRPILLKLISNVYAEQDNKKIMPCACACEMIHCYSLIHDDLPCMDDDDYRRGKLSTHKKFGEAIAVLAGDALNTYAFYCLIGLQKSDLDKGKIIKIIEELSLKSSSHGLIGGQAADLESENKKLKLSDLEYIHKNKTAALITASMKIGAIVSGAGKKEINLIEKIGEQTGLLFQIVDDILDVTGDSKQIGKPAGSDEKNNKLTYPSLLGIKKSKGIAENLKNNLLKNIKKIEYKSKKHYEILKDLPEFLLKRIN